MDQYVLVGRTRKTQGVKGNIKLEIKEQFVEDVLNTEIAFLKVQGKLLPYFIEKFDFTNALTVKFEDIDSPEAAIPITSKEYYLREQDISQVSEYQEGELEFGKLIGFEIFDQRGIKIGPIQDIQEFPQQEIAIVNYHSKDLYIPLNEQLILSVDLEKQAVHMDLPDGLLEL